MSNVINLLEHPKFLKSKPPQEEPGYSQWVNSLSDYFKNQPVMTFHFKAGETIEDVKFNPLTSQIVGTTASEAWFDDITTVEEDTTPDYLIVMDLLEDCIKEGNYRSAKAAVEMLDDIVERMEKKTLDKPD